MVATPSLRAAAGPSEAACTPAHRLILAHCRAWDAFARQGGDAAPLVAAHLADLVRAAHPPLPAQWAKKAIGEACALAGKDGQQALSPLIQALVAAARPWEGDDEWGWQAAGRACTAWTSPPLLQALLDAPRAPPASDLSSRLLDLRSPDKTVAWPARTLLGHALASGEAGLPLAQALLARGVDPNAPVDADQHSPLALAQPKAFARLLHAGADPLADTPGLGLAALQGLRAQPLRSRPEDLPMHAAALADAWPLLAPDQQARLADALARRLGTVLAEPAQWRNAQSLRAALQPLAVAGVDLAPARARAALAALRGQPIKAISSHDGDLSVAFGPFTAPRQPHQMVPGVDDAAWPLALAVQHHRQRPVAWRQEHHQDLAAVLPHLPAGPKQWRVLAALAGTQQGQAWPALAHQVARDTVAALLDPRHPHHADARTPWTTAEPGWKPLSKFARRRVRGLLHNPVHVPACDASDIATWLELLLLYPHSHGLAMEVLEAWFAAADATPGLPPVPPAVQALVQAPILEEVARHAGVPHPERLRALRLAHTLGPAAPSGASRPRM